MNRSSYHIITTPDSEYAQKPNRYYLKVPRRFRQENGGKVPAAYRVLPPDKILQEELKKHGVYPGAKVDMAMVNSTSKLRDLLAARDFIAHGGRRPGRALRILGYEVPPSANYDIQVTDEEIRTALTSFYPIESVQRAYADPRIKLPPLKRFLTDHQRVNDRLKKRGLNLERAINDLYPEFPHLYNRITTQINCRVVDRKILVQELIKLDELGVDLSPTTMSRTSNPANRVYRRVMAYARVLNRKLPEDKACDYTKTVRRLLGKQTPGYLSDEFTNKIKGDLGEQIFRLMVMWAMVENKFGEPNHRVLMGYFGGPITDFQQSAHGEARILRYKNGRLASSFVPDFRVDTEKDSIAVDVKTGTRPSNRTEITKMVEKYGDPQDDGEIRVWYTNGEPPKRITAELERHPMTKGMIVLNQESVRRETITRLTDNNIIVIEAAEVQNCLEEVVRIMDQEPYKRFIRDTKPVLNDPEHLIRFYRELVFAPHVLFDPGNRRKLKLSYMIMQALVNKAGQLLKEV